MKILGIETSCDETAVSIIEAEGGLAQPRFRVLGHSLFSQVALHKEYGGVYPNLARREHGKNIIPLLIETLKKAGMFGETTRSLDPELITSIESILSREPALLEELKTVVARITAPNIDAIAVTRGPGLPPALWVGVSFAEALGLLWNIPVIPVDHMEGHIVSVLADAQAEKDVAVTFPALAVLVSGGHTEFVHMTRWGEYKIIGKTRDDAIGEAFDKVARLMSLPYPGGPEISRRANQARQEAVPHKALFPRPMIHSGDFDVSFSGLKTAVLYYIRDTFNGAAHLTEHDTLDIARAFEDAAVEVIVEKTRRAIEDTGVHTLIVAGGVVANIYLRSELEKMIREFPGTTLLFPTKELSTDNAIMIACAAYIDSQRNPAVLTGARSIRADGNLSLER